MGRREENKSDKRRRLAEAGRDAFLAEGWSAASIERIATEAGVARGTFYLYFADKDALFEAVVAPLFDGLEAAIGEARAALAAVADVEGAHATYVALGLRLGAALLDARDLVRIYFAEARAPGAGGAYVRRRMTTIEGQVDELLREAIARGLLRPHDTRTVTLVLIGGVERLTWAWLEGDETLDATALPETITRVFREGIGLTPG
ncbi:MAG: TetR/AcrR family transcriptional regulator [Myxococcota bacterium]